MKGTYLWRSNVNEHDMFLVRAVLLWSSELDESPYTLNVMHPISTRTISVCGTVELLTFSVSLEFIAQSDRAYLEHGEQSARCNQFDFVDLSGVSQGPIELEKGFPIILETLLDHGFIVITQAHPRDAHSTKSGSVKILI
jgi:hypothetical protein